MTVSDCVAKTALSVYWTLYLNNTGNSKKIVFGHFFCIAKNRNKILALSQFGGLQVVNEVNSSGHSNKKF